MAGDAQIGNLLILLQANTAKLDEQIQQSKAHLDSFKGSLDIVKNALIAIGALVVFDKVIGATADMQKAQALLESQIKATGDASGYTTAQLDAMADSFSHVSTSSKEQIEGLEAQLMAFRNIAGEQFRGAIQAALDFSAVTGRDATEAIKSLGMALNDPVTGMTKLSKAGIDLTEGVKQTVKALAEQGDLVGAQNVLLQQMEKSYGGAAAAARDTLGGALAGLKNDFNELLASGGTPELTQSIKDLDQTLQDPNIKTGIANLIAGMTTLVSWVVEATSHISNLGQNIGEFFAKLQGYTGNFDDQINAAKVHIQQIQDQIAGLESGGTPKDSPAIAQLQKQLFDYQNQLIAVQAQQQLITGKTAGDATPKKTFQAPELDALMKPDFGSFKNIDDLQTLTQGNFAGLKSQTDQVKEDQQKVLEIWKQNDPKTFLEQEIADTKALINTVVNGRIFTADDAAKHIQDMADKSDEAFTQMTEFSKRAAANMQDELAKSLFEPMHNGFRGMLEDWAKTLEKMIDQLIAANLMNKLFGSFDSSGKGGGEAGFAALMSKGLSSIFGSSSSPSTGSGHASGGGVSGGTMYPVNEMGPELYTDSGGNQFLLPSSDGFITPNSALGGGHSFHVNIDARGAGPDETARIVSFGAALENSIKGQVEHRLQRGGWPQGRRQT